MTNQTHRIDLDGYTYTWDGEGWYNSKTFAVPPTAVIMRLNALLGKMLGLKPRKLG